MIVDLILDRREGKKYKASEFYRGCFVYGDIGTDITAAMDYGSEKDVKDALKQYIEDQEYNQDIKSFIDAVDWLEDD